MPERMYLPTRPEGALPTGVVAYNNRNLRADSLAAAVFQLWFALDSGDWTALGTAIASVERSWERLRSVAAATSALSFTECSQFEARLRSVFDAIVGAHRANPKPSATLSEQFDAMKRFEQVGNEIRVLTDETEQIERDVSAKKRGMASQAGAVSSTLSDWARGPGEHNLAIVFTDIVDSTKLCTELGDSRWSNVLQAHYQRARDLIAQLGGHLVKTVGDSVLALFRNADSATKFAIGFRLNPGHERTIVRIGIHVGPVEIKDGDVFGENVNLTARVIKSLCGAGIMVTAEVKEHLERRKEATKQQLTWQARPGLRLDGFDGVFDLWEVEVDEATRKATL